MKEFIKIIVVFVFLFSPATFAQLGTTTATLTSDVASNGGFSNGSGNGSGWSSSWQVYGQSGNGNIFTNGTAIGNGFGMWSQNNNETYVVRYFDEFLKKGDALSFDIGHTGTVNGEVGINFR